MIENIVFAFKFIGGMFFFIWIVGAMWGLLINIIAWFVERLELR